MTTTSTRFQSAAQASTPAPFGVLAPAQMLQIAEDGATAKVTSPPLKSFLSAITAGGFIGIGFAFYLTTQVGAEGAPWGLARLAGALTFSTGLLLVVLTGAELFTSSTLALVGRASGRYSWAELARNWAVVYCGNFVGSIGLASLMFVGGTWMLNHGAWGAVLLKTAESKASYTFLQAFALGILCNLLVCLAVWVTYAGRSSVDKIASLMPPIAMFVAVGFEHSVANMFLMPFALVVKAVAPASFWTAAGITPDAFPHLTWEAFLLGNLLPVSLGNIVGGGVMVGLLYWFLFNVADQK